MPVNVAVAGCALAGALAAAGPAWATHGAVTQAQRPGGAVTTTVGHPGLRWLGRLAAGHTQVGTAEPAVAGPPGAALSGVSCTSATACTATGAVVTSGGSLRTLAERWNGTSWTVQTTPTPSSNGRTGGALQGVSCTSGTACVAAGYSTGTGGHRLLGEGWDGTKWISQPYWSPAPVATPFGMDCAWREDCIAVGTRASGGTLAEHWNGKKWSAQTTKRRGLLIGASCPANKSCTAVGFSAAGHNLAEHWNGSSWSVQTSPTFTAFSVLTGVSCLSSSDCFAAGLKGSGSVYRPLAEHWNGTKWSVLSAPNPSPTSDVEFNAVSCTSATNCMAVGDSADPAGTSDMTFAAQWNGSAWTVQVMPSSPTFSALLSVSCTSTTACVAVGVSATTAGGTLSPLVETWDGTSWTVSSNVPS